MKQKWKCFLWCIYKCIFPIRLMESIKGLINLSEDFFVSLSLAFILFILEENKDSVYFSFSNYFMYVFMYIHMYIKMKLEEQEKEEKGITLLISYLLLYTPTIQKMDRLEKSGKNCFAAAWTSFCYSNIKQTSSPVSLLVLCTIALLLLLSLLLACVLCFLYTK